MGAAPCQVTTEPTRSLDHACGLTSISLSFKELFLFLRHHGNSVPRHVDKSRSFSCARKSVHKKHFGVGLVPSVLQLCGQREPLKTYFQFCYYFFLSPNRGYQFNSMIPRTQIKSIKARNN